MSYEAGNLELSIMGFSTDAVSNIDVTAKALNRLASAVDKVNNSFVSRAGENLELMFIKIAKATNSINVSNINNLAIATKSLSSLSRVTTKISNMDFSKAVDGFQNLAVAIQPFLDKIKQAEASLVALNGTLNAIGGDKSNGGKGNNKNNNKKSGILNIAKWTAVLYLARRLGRTVANIVQSGADYTETLNLWETAMGNNLSMATEFVNQMNKAYGISEKTLMNAQAIFKNMLGSLGQITDEMAYSLSESITQMAVDYASLYNVNFESAFTKFQAALAGQVRPIRSVSGYDITENTLFQLYQSLGGTKTMRQLSRTEKQLLSILAIFNQMNASGAVGDLKKTMGSFANQSRVWAESLTEVKTWLGVIISYTIQESGIMIKLNAILITVARYLEAVARGIGAVQSFGGSDPFAGTEQSAEDAGDAVDELNGKLLDFDKFRSLTGSENVGLNIDEKLASALSGYSSIMSGASNEARELSDKWLRMLGFVVDTNGELVLTEEQLEKAKEEIDSITEELEEFDALSTLKQIYPLFKSFVTTLTALIPSILTISTTLSPIIVGLVSAFATLVKILDTLHLLELVVIAIIGLKIAAGIGELASGLSKFSKHLTTFFKNLKTNIPLAVDGVTKLQVAFAQLSYAFALGSLVYLLTSEMSAGEKLTHMFIGLAAAIVAAAIAISMFKANWAQALTAAGVVAGGYYTIQALSVPNYENGASNIDSGTIFRAGEFGKTEAVYTGSNGKTNVANIQQMKTAYSQALGEWWKTAKYDIPAFQGVSDSGIYTIVDGEAKRRGKKFANV